DGPEAPFVGIYYSRPPVDDKEGSRQDHESQGDRDEAAEERHAVQDNADDDVYEEEDKEVAETVPGIEEIAYPGLPLAPRHLEERAGIAGNKADVGDGDPDNQHEDQRKDNKVRQVFLPDPHRVAEQDGEVVLPGGAGLLNVTDHRPAMLALDRTVNDLLFAERTLHPGLLSVPTAGVSGLLITHFAGE